ncbi:endospore germination permease [Tepidibacillus sp. HK-1]|uniref:GerAB/ArcD/ProY family transporter n=1 Tax=Tepidibacillus sp. HK-1 TaxID=1883407 RepID=UPI0008537916|nr:endospore germination permease [Tepidibacillus sp. HK-1]GBF10184.1 spore germination protein YndE [Tepidibacillus sp. HK-1]
MLKNGRINQFQLWLLIINYLIGSALIFVPGMVTSQSKQDSWISLLAAIGLGSLLLLILVMIANRFPNQTLVEISQTLFGKVFGTIIALIYATYFILLSGILLRELGDMITTTVLKETPIIAFIAMIGILVFFATKQGLETIGRINEIISLLAVGSVWLTISLVIPLMKLERLSPILTHGLKPIIKGSFTALSFTYLEMTVFLMILPFLNIRKHLTRIVISGGLVAGFSLFAIVVSTILVLNVRPTELSIFAPLNMARLINIGGFLTRIESFIILAYIITIFIKLVITFYAGVLSLTQIFKLTDYQPIVIPLLIITIALSTSMIESITDFIDFITTTWFAYMLALGFILPLIMLGASYFKRK